MTVEITDDVDSVIRRRLESDFINDARKVVSKGARPDYIRIARIPRNFKGAIIYPKLKQEFIAQLKSTGV